MYSLDFSYITLVTAMASNSISIFQKLEKFTGQQGSDLSAWLRGFERCCVIHGKSDDDLVKGQLLMLCLDGQALAVADRLEQEKKASQKFKDLKAKLEEVFNSDADKEHKQELFEKRHQEIGETEDEFMLSLTNLHRSANPDADEADLTRNVKRKFMNGISAGLKRNVFIFCNKPHDANVTIDNLLEAVRRANLYMSERSDVAETVNAIEGKLSENNAILKAIEGVRDSLNSHIQSTGEQFREQSAQINAISQQQYQNDFTIQQTDGHYNNRQGGSRGRYNNRNRGRGNQNRGGNRRGNNRGPIVCFKCGEPNHVARDCRAHLN